MRRKNLKPNGRCEKGNEQLNSHMRIILTELGLAILIALLSACTPPAPSPTPVPTVTPSPNATPTSVPFNHAGRWDAGTLPDGLISGELIFQVENEQITAVEFSYTMRFNGCTVTSNFSGTADEFSFSGNDFGATMYAYDKSSELNITGTFTSAKQANGTLTYKGNYKDCGAFERSVKWNGENGPLPPTPTATRSKPTATPTAIASPTLAATPGAPKSTPPQVIAHLDQPFTLKIGQAAIVDDTTEKFGIQFHSVIEDTRCPRQMLCYQAGQARLYIEPMRDGALLPPLLELATSKPSINFGNYRIQLRDVQPYPERDGASKEIAPDVYVATFVVSKIAAPTTPTTISGVPARLNEPFPLKVGQWATLSDGSDTRIIFTTVREDSRCPTNPSVRCEGTGRALIGVTLESGGKLAQFDLSTNPGEYRAGGGFNGYLVQLLDVYPAPVVISPRIPPNDYLVTLVVSKGSLNVTTAKFNEAFALKPGQTIGVQGSSMRVTFESVKQDSRCPTRAVCATSGTATIAVRLWHDDTSDLVTLDVGGKGVMTSFPVMRTVSMIVYAAALSPYPQQEFASKEISPSDYEAMLLIYNPAVPLVTPTVPPRIK